MWKYFLLVNLAILIANAQAPVGDTVADSENLEGDKERMDIITACWMLTV